MFFNVSTDCTFNFGSGTRAFAGLGVDTRLYNASCGPCFGYIHRGKTFYIPTDIKGTAHSTTTTTDLTSALLGDDRLGNSVPHPAVCLLC